MSIASTILSQLGGNRFVAMTGAKNLVDNGNGLGFAIGRNSSRANLVRVTLAADDTYTVEFYRFAKLEGVKLATTAGVYCDALRSVFEGYTGLATSL
jgi:hypothetical protein